MASTSIKTKELMRRKDKEITSRKEIEAIIRKSTVCRLALTDEEYPYLVPLCFGYKDNSLYFHSSPKGKKLDLIKKNNTVCFEFDIVHEIKVADSPCEWGMKYESVIGFGEASFIEDPDSKQKALDIIMEQYSDRSSLCSETKVRQTVIIKVEIMRMTGKRSR
jgi:nitroimidazol reductase NimA-like FMN-containing flavoprotein (pyridoxamine 5'-phosphate oxidase superfamily)